MHELSIVSEMILVAQEKVRYSGIKGRITRLKMLIGRLSPMKPDAVLFAFDMLSRGTKVEGAYLDIERPYGFCLCGHCGARARADGNVLVCPTCGSNEVSLEGGRELQLELIDVET